MRDARGKGAPFLFPRLHDGWLLGLLCARGLMAAWRARWRGVAVAGLFVRVGVLCGRPARGVRLRHTMHASGGAGRPRLACGCGAEPAAAVAAAPRLPRRSPGEASVLARTCGRAALGARTGAPPRAPRRIAASERLSLKLALTDTAAPARAPFLSLPRARPAVFVMVRPVTATRPKWVS